MTSLQQQPPSPPSTPTTCHETPRQLGLPHGGRVGGREGGEGRGSEGGKHGRNRMRFKAMRVRGRRCTWGVLKSRGTRRGEHTSHNVPGACVWPLLGIAPAPGRENLPRPVHADSDLTGGSGGQRSGGQTGAFRHLTPVATRGGARALLTVRGCVCARRARLSRRCATR